MFYQIFLSPQVKRWMIITYKHGIYELPHELLSDLRLRNLGNYEISGNCLNSYNDSLVPIPPAKNESFVAEKQKLNFFRCALFNMKTRVSLKYFVSYYPLGLKYTLLPCKPLLSN